MINLSSRQLRRAADIKDKIESLQSELSRLLGDSGPAAVPGKRRRMSAAGRARIAAAARARWAAFNRNKATKQPARKRRGAMSAAAKARLSARMKAIWQARKAKKK